MQIYHTEKHTFHARVHASAVARLRPPKHVVMRSPKPQLSKNVSFRTLGYSVLDSLHEITACTQSLSKMECALDSHCWGTASWTACMGLPHVPILRKPKCPQEFHRTKKGHGRQCNHTEECGCTKLKGKHPFAAT